MNETIVKYRTDIVPESVYNNATSIQYNLTVYTDCPDYAVVTIPYSSQQSTSGGQHTTLPCLRIDKVYWNTSTGLGASLAGADVTGSGCFPYGYVFPDKQQVQIYVSGTWQAINLWKWNPAGSPAKIFLTYSGEINYWDVWYIDMTQYDGGPTTISAGTYQVRYRNKQIGGTGGPCVTNPADSWITESWYLSI